MDLADASLLLLAEHLGHGKILSTDIRDFNIYRWQQRKLIKNLMLSLSPFKVGVYSIKKGFYKLMLYKESGHTWQSFLLRALATTFFTVKYFIEYSCVGG